MMSSKKACDACHKRKIQCDATSADSPCNWCSHHGMDCTFNRVRGRRKTKPKTRAGSEKDLSERLEKIEFALAQRLNENDPSPNIRLFTPDESSPRSSTSLPSKARSSTTLGDVVDAYEFQGLSVQSPSAKSPSAVSTSSISYGQLHFAGCHLGHVNSHNGIPLFSREGQKLVAMRTGEFGATERLNALVPEARAAPLSIYGAQFKNSERGLLELPDRKVVEDALLRFTQSSFRLVFPLVDKVLFQGTIELAYQSLDGTPSLEQISAIGSVLAFVSIMCLFEDERNSLMAHDLVDFDTCAIQAHYLLTDILEESSLTSLQTVFMLHLHQAFSGRLQSGATLHAMSCRLVFSLGGHVNRDIKPWGAELTIREREARHLRILFFMCYIFDKDIALRTGQPPIMSDEYCDLTFPEGYMENHFSTPTIGSLNSPEYADDSLIPYLPGDIRLSVLKDKACRLLYSAQALRKSDAELLRSIRELDAELEDWRLSVPPDFRPSLSIAKNTPLMPEMTLPHSMQRIVLHLEYHHLTAAIHRASGKCYFGADLTNFELREKNGAVESSMALSLEASRSTLFYLEAAVNGLAGEAFWVVIFYPTVAIMTLFFNILINPLDPQSELDVQHLGSAAQLIRCMPIRRLTSYEIGHVKRVNDFVAELIRLGNCAIAKAKAERDMMSVD